MSYEYPKSRASTTKMLKLVVRSRKLFLTGVLIVLAFTTVSYLVKQNTRKRQARLKQAFKDTDLLVNSLIAKFDPKQKAEDSNSVVSSKVNITPKSDPAPPSPSSVFEQYFTKASVQVWEYSYMYLIEPMDVCDTVNAEYVVLVLSSASSTERRQAIRSTWAARAFAKRVVVMFVLGDVAHTSQRLEEESDTYQDILQLEFRDIYRHLTLKTFAALQWVTERCSQVEFVVKTDDDVILNLMELRELVKLELEFDKNLILGASAPNRLVQREGKWSVKKEDYPFEYYPQYVSGGLYAMGISAVSKIVDTCEYVPRIPVEDVFITGIVRKVLKIPVTNSNRFPSWLTRTPRSECQFIAGQLVGLHGYGPSKMSDLWQRFDLDDASGC